jgi:predicted O-methyltransferase YrrM
VKRTPELRAVARRLGRARLLTKRRVLRHFGHPVFSRQGLRYLARDPEVDSFTYRIVNEHDLTALLADLTGDPLQTMAALFREAPDSLEVGWGLGHKRHIPVSGFHGSLYALTRRLRPCHVLETGVLDGVGSLLVLEALARNRSEGVMGQLTSIDIDPYAGRLVSRRPDLAPHWRPVTGDSRDVLPRFLAEWERIDLFINDSAAGRDLQARELELVLPRLAEGGAVVTAQDFHGVMGPATLQRGMAYHRFQERPHDHFYPGRILGFAVGRPGTGEETA